VRSTSNKTNYYGSGVAGGLVGMNEMNSSIEMCYATGDVNGYVAGGLVGINDAYEGKSGDGKAYIMNCYATGNVTGANAGGLVGSNEKATYNGSSSYAVVENSYAIGNVDGITGAGGLIGNVDGSEKNVYRYSEQIVSGTVNTVGVAKEMSELTSVTFQVSTLTWSVNDWIFIEGEHPVLKNVGATI
jgi:hypothetical protein